MRYTVLAIAVIGGIFWGDQAASSVSEQEPNSPAIGSVLIASPGEFSPPGCSTEPADYNAKDNGDGTFTPASKSLCTLQVYRTVDYPSSYDSSSDPSLANPFPLTDQLVGQLSGPRDYDWFYVDISAGAAAAQPATPVYFGCDTKYGIYYEGFDTAPSSDPYWTINYYYDADPATAGGLEFQSSYVVYKEVCKRGTAETKGPFRFQMNTQRAGRYYVRVWGRYIGDVKSEQSISVPVLQSDGTTKAVTVTIRQFKNQILAYTSDYTFRVYTGRIPGELEPNDGMVEAYPLTADVPIAAQLASMYDQDWYVVDNDVAVNTAKTLTFNFSCKGQTGTTYLLSSLNGQGVVQTSYEITATQCSVDGGFKFTINTPVSGKYYLAVASPTYTDTAAFTQSDYTVGVSFNTSGGGASRKDGQLEPNDRLVDAYPIAPDTLVVTQLYAVTDLDYFSIDHDATQDPSGSTSVYFRCDAVAAAADYQLSTYDSQGVLQSSNTIAGSQCTPEGGYRTTIQTPSSGRYYLLVAAPADQAKFSDANYMLSTYPSLDNTDAAMKVVAKLKSARVVDNTRKNKDQFTINLGQCGSNKGNVKVVGSKLNLGALNKSLQVKVQLGGWTCVSDPSTTGVDDSQPNKKIYEYPIPPAPTPAPAEPPTGIFGKT